ncbi:MAG: N-acetylmuramoyl-L-alanine amidase [Anaerolineales bacterium]
MVTPTIPNSSRSNESSRTGRILQTAFSVAFLLATLFTGFSPKMFSGNFGAIISGILTPQPDGGGAVPTTQKPVRIGIVSGHWGNGGDPGAVCPDGTNEHDINLTIASLVRQKLEARGYNIDLLQEFDPRLDGYQAALLLSIHNDTCDVIDAQATGFKLASSTYSRDQNLTDRLSACLYDRYGRATGLPYLSGNITVNMTDYHAFRAIDPSTPASIIETGFLNLDRSLLVDHPDVVADGVVAGVLCFVRSESVQPIPTP